MEINKKLLMTFKTTDDRKISLSIDDPREDITEDEIKDEAAFLECSKREIRDLILDYAKRS